MAAYNRSMVRARVIAFKHETRLVEWCQANNTKEAIVGGFFLRAHYQALGDLWIDGHRRPTVPFDAPWDKVRGSVSIEYGELELGARGELPNRPTGDLLQAGPLLVKNGVPLIHTGEDCEGLTVGAGQFDSDISDGRHPRTAIGTSDSHIFCVAVDGRDSHDAGLTLGELAELMIMIGATDALNLDGGGSASLVSGGQLINHPRGDGHEYRAGRPIHTALIFEPRS